MLFDICLIVLAAWRLTSVINREKVAESLRRVLGVREGDHFKEIDDTFTAYLVDCFWCLSFWVSVGVLGIWYAYPPLLYPLAISAAVILIEGAREWLEPT